MGKGAENAEAESCRRLDASAFREEFPFLGTESRGCLGKTCRINTTLPF